MRIGEAAERTGLSISNIRFYEKKGLLEPEREQQSKYRDYSEEDVERLNRILLYRKMDLSIEVIQSVLDKETSLEQALEAQIVVLNEKKDMIQGSIDLCRVMLENQFSDTYDTAYYLNYGKEEETKGHKFAEIEEILEDFAAFTNFNVLASDRMWGWIFESPRRLRLARIIWSSVLILLPAIAVIDQVINSRGTSKPGLFAVILFWIFLVAAVGTSFVHFRKN